MRQWQWIIFCAATLGVGAAQAAPIIDGMTDTTHFSNADISGVSASQDTASTVKLTRDIVGGDPGIDWKDIGGFRISLTADHDTLIVEPTALTTGASYAVNLLFFDSVGGYISEKAWVSPSDTSTQTLPSVSAFAAANSVVGADSYFVRLRVIGNQGDALTLSQIAAVPEPASMLLLGAPAGMLLLRRKRR